LTFIVGEGISRPKVPRTGAVLGKPRLGLKFPRTIRDAFISQTLSLHQVFGGSSLKQTGSHKTDSASVGMGSYVLDHGTPALFAHGLTHGSVPVSNSARVRAETSEYKSRFTTHSVILLFACTFNFCFI
jgi:hypothetical protein